ncbi:MAG: PPOX class F420-dependent oxidoreductase [Acidimicrobiales bacterium]
MANIADEKYVVLTTTKKNGQTVPTAVWIAALPDGSLGFTTELTSGKVKRIRNFPEVTLQPSNARGVVKPGSSPITARASVLTGDEVTPVETAIKAKYGFMVTLIGVTYSIRKLFKRSDPAPRAAIRLEL